MDRRRITWTTRVVAGLSALLMEASGVLGVEPESGIYYNPAFQGRGYFVEVQGGIVSVIVYAHDEQTGKPDWFLASGPLRDDAGEVPGSDPIPLAGYYPVHWMTGTLYRFNGGPCMVCGPRRDAEGNVIPLAAERVGTLSLYWDFLRAPTVYIDPDLGQVSADVLFERIELVRTSFGHVNFGRTDLPGTQLFDQAGHWIFSSKDRVRAPIDVVWGPAKITDLGAPAGLPALTAYRAEYSDSGSLWTMTCHIGYRALPVAVRPPENKRSGCEFSNNGAVVFSALQMDIGLSESFAFLGPLPSEGSDTLRGAITLRGYRVE